MAEVPGPLEFLRDFLAPIAEMEKSARKPIVDAGGPDIPGPAETTLGFLEEAPAPEKMFAFPFAFPFAPRKKVVTAPPPAVIPPEIVPPAPYFKYG